jgi:hypothetical protein
MKVTCHDFILAEYQHQMTLPTSQFETPIEVIQKPTYFPATFLPSGSSPQKSSYFSALL